MTRYVSLALGVAFLATDATWAQVGSVSPYNRPNINPRATVSPMIRLRDGGGAITYFGQIRPQMQNTRAIQQLQGDFQNFEQQLGGAYGLPQDQIILPTTGHPVRYFDYSYFFRMGGGVAGQPFSGGNLGGSNFGNFNNTGGATSRGVMGIIR